MAVSLIFVWSYNGILIILLGIYGSRLLIKTYEHIKDEQTNYDYDDKERLYFSNEMFMEELKITARKFWLSFYIVELALLAFFIFWDIMFYYNIKIV